MTHFLHSVIVLGYNLFRLRYVEDIALTPSLHFHLAGN